MQAGRLLSHSPSSPSFECYSSVNLAEIAARVVEESGDWSRLPERGTPLDEGNDGVGGKSAVDEEDFEFALVCGDPVVTADEIFCNGQIRPLQPYSIFNSDFDSVPNSGDSAVPEQTIQHHRPPLRKLMSEERESSSASCSSSETDNELNGVPPETYCVWTPGRANTATGGVHRHRPYPPWRRKIESNSTGSSKLWRLRDLLYTRSNSDGKETFMFLAPIKKNEKNIGKSNGGEENEALKEQSPRKERGGESYFTRNRSGGAAVGRQDKPKRRSYVPYRKDLLEIFAHVNGLSRNLHPF